MRIPLSFSAILFILPLLLLPFLHAAQPAFLLSWPTPNPAFAKGMGYSAFLQKTGPDKAYSSGAFGCVRNHGFKFHEGLDLFPVKRDGRGRAEDKVFSAMGGVVRHINPTSSHSAYGKYLVLEHTRLDPPLYSLYAHLASIEPDLKAGSPVKVAQVLGKMGNTASYRIPLDRSHLHFEIGLRLTDDFQGWYDKKPYKTRNRHGNYSGFNLVGIDPLLLLRLPEEILRQPTRLPALPARSGQDPRPLLPCPRFRPPLPHPLQRPGQGIRPHRLGLFLRALRHPFADRTGHPAPLFKVGEVSSPQRRPRHPAEALSQAGREKRKPTGSGRATSRLP